MKNVNDIARSLYDGGWRCEDLNDIMEEYDCSYEEAYDICSALELLEREDKYSSLSNLIICKIATRQTRASCYTRTEN